MATGSVARFDVRRGYGFVIPDDGGEDVFVHQNNILMDGFRYLKAGEHVSYELEVGEKGMKAVRVELLDPRPPEPVREQRPLRESYRDERPPRAAAAASSNGSGSGSEDVRRLRRKLERLISILVERDILGPEDMDTVENGFAATAAANPPVAASATDSEDDEYEDDYED